MREFEYPVLDCEAIGGRIREERVRRSFTIQEVCDALSVSPQAVGKWQRGESLPSIDNLVALCTLFDVSLEGILFGEDRMSFRWAMSALRQRIGRFTARPKSIAGKWQRDYEILPINSTNSTLSRIIWYFLFKKQPHMKSTLLLNYA